MIEGPKPYAQSVDDFSRDNPRGFTRIRVHPRHPCNPCSIASPRFDLCSSAVNIRTSYKPSLSTESVSGFSIRGYL
jgi:hypothetical protein